jgi:hypothetical protein
MARRHSGRTQSIVAGLALAGFNSDVIKFEPRVGVANLRHLQIG